jgi:hypothetical protein
MLIAIASYCLQARAQEPVAMATSVDGEATVESGGVTTRLEIGNELAQGAVVRVASGRAALVFMSGDLMDLATGDVLTLGPDMGGSTLTSEGTTRGVTKEDGVTVAEEGIGKANSEKWQSQLAYIYGVRGDASVVAVAPRLAVASPTPVFYWFDGDSLNAGMNKTYTLVLKDGDGKELFRKNVDGIVYEMNSYVPQPMPAEYRVEPGLRYAWTVAAKDGETTSEASYIYIDEAGIDLATEKRRKLDELRSAGKVTEQSYNTLMAMYFLDERERLFSDALPYLLALEAQPGGRQYATTQLALLFNRFGNEVSTVAAYYARKTR